MWKEIKNYYLQKNPIKFPIGNPNLRLKKTNSQRDIFKENNSINKQILKDKTNKELTKSFSSSAYSYHVIQKYGRKKQKNNIRINKLPLIPNSSSPNLRSSEIIIRRKMLFSDSDCPLSINDSNNDLFRFSMTNSANFLLNNNLMINLNYNSIIEELDDEKKMIKYLPNDAFYVLNDVFTFQHKSLYNFIINKLQDKLNYVDLKKNNFHLTKKFITGKNKKDEIILNLNSFCIKFLNYENKEVQRLYLPFDIIPFYYAFSYDNFMYFLSKILDVNSNENFTKLKTETINNIINDFLNLDTEIFNSDSNFFSNKSQEIKSFPFLKNNTQLKIQIIPPLIELIKNNNIFIYKIAGKGLLIYLLKINFNNWDIPCLCYLSSFKIFRQSISNLFYKECNYKKTILDIDLEYNHNILRKTKNKKFFYQFLNDSIYFFNLTSYIIDINVNDNSNIFQTSLLEFKILYKLSKKYNIKDIIYKCSFINNKTKKALFSLDLLNGIEINQLDNFFYKFDEDNKNHIQIKISNPSLQWSQLIKKSNPNQIIKHTLILKDEFLDELAEFNLFDWYKFFAVKEEILKRIIKENELSKKFSTQSCNLLPKSKVLKGMYGRRNTSKKVKSTKFDN